MSRKTKLSTQRHKRKPQLSTKRLKLPLRAERGMQLQG
jgi:hypothetical protein